MWCLSCLKPSTSEDPFEAEIDLALDVSREEADIQEAKQLAFALQESSLLQKQQEEKRRAGELEKDAQIARAFQYDETERELDNDSALEDEKDEQPAKIAVESFQDKGKLKQFEEQVKNDEQVAQDLQNRFNKMAYEESPGLLHVLDDKDEQLAKTVKSSKEKRRSKQLEEQVKKDELVAQDLQNRFNKRAFEESHDNAVLDELANTVKSFKEKRKSKQFEEQVKSDEQVAQDLQNLLSEMPYKESAGLHDNSVLGNEGEQFPKTVGRSLKVKGKEKILEDEQVKKDEELALVLQESLNMVEPPPRPRIEERKSIPRRAALDVKKSSKEKGKGKKSEGEQVKKDEELALILQESLNMVEPPPPPPNEEHKSISRRAAFDVQEQLAKEKGKGKQIEDEQVKKDEQLAVIVQESLNMVESPEEDSNISSSRAPMDEDEQRIIWESLKGKGLLTQPEDEVEDVGQLLEANPAPPPSRCGGCYCEIEQERSVDVLGVLWHPECLICGACHNPITIHEVETHVSNLRGKFHKNCYRRYCYVCQEKVKIRMFNKHPFWKENYCPDHDSDGTHKCFSCERLEPKGTDFVELDDGRRLCLQCMDSAVMDTYEVQPLHFEIREFFEGLNMKIEREFPFLLVEKQALNKAEEEEKIDNQEDGVVTRGICLSEEQIVTSVSKGPKMGPNKQLIGKTTESQKVVSGCPVTAILILYGLPRLLTGYILAHEMMHAYLRLNGCRNLNNVMEEGICQVLGHMWLETQTYATIDAAASSAAPAPAAAESSSSSSRTPSEASAGKKGEWSEFEKKLVEFCKNQIETDESAAYGDGFRKVNHMVTNSSLKDTLKEILRRG
ncbi:hypothetical protein HID58_026051 [Brassica napus]|uniref:LIM zinc-binding domain-containing protein n=1 Tax=Brassica napus TaxID=3708 RepID=A0ABQ8CMW1_BRANA|nr:hypothetical protein HID58_026051 [Brassica napus]